MHNPLPRAGSDRATGCAGRFVAQRRFRLAAARERAAMIETELDVHTVVEYGTAVILELAL